MQDYTFSIVYSDQSKAFGTVKVILTKANYIRALIKAVSPKHLLAFTTENELNMFKSFSQDYSLALPNAVQA